MKRFPVSGFEFRACQTARPAFNSELATRDSKPGFGALALAALLIAWPLGSGAQVLNDPTRPPPVFSNPPGDTGAAAGPLLQSVMISPAGRSAIIGGEIVKLGGKYGDARVVKITANEVVLRSANGTEILRMYPEVNMKAVRHAPAAGK